MTPQEFIAALEQQSSAKEADVKGTLVQNAITGVANAGKRFLERAPAVQNFMRAPVNSTLHAGLRTLEGTGNLGQKAMEMGRKGLNYVDDTARHTLNVPQAAGPKRLGNRVVAPLQRATRFTDSTGQIRVNNLHPTSLGAGLATAGGGLMGAKYMLGGYKGGPAPAPQPQQLQMPTAASGGGLMDMWNSLPIEARYAIGAGVPLALLGAFTHGSGSQTAGLGLGAAGLGLAGLGAARGGMFGSNMQSGAEGLMNMLTGQRDHRLRNDPAYHAYLQGQLSNGLAQNSAMSKKSAYEFGSKVARCWAGYEPVPGKAPYSNDSCRPKKQKSKKTEKKAIAGCGQTSMPATPSSRGLTKRVSDQQKSTPSPKPEDVGLAQLSKESAAYLWAAQLRADLEKEAFLGAIARGIGSGLGSAGNYIQGLGSAAQKGLNNFADAADQRGKQMYYSGARMYNNAVQPLRAAGAAVGGFGQGLVQGAQNIASLPGQAVNAVGGAIQDTGAAIGDAAGTAFGAGRNAVVNTARDVRQGVNTAVDTAKSYVPSVRNPFYYSGTPGQPVGPQYGPQF